MAGKTLKMPQQMAVYPSKWRGQKDEKIAKARPLTWSSTRQKSTSINDNVSEKSIKKVIVTLNTKKSLICQ